MNTHDRRLAQLEAKRSAGSVELGVLFMPADLSAADRAEWLARHPVGGDGQGIIVIPRKGDQI